MSLVWYVLRSKPHKENFFEEQLIAHRIEVYCPCIKKRVVHSHVCKTRPYFPGYLFVHVDLQNTTLSFLNWMPGSQGMILFGAQPASVPDTLIAAIRRRVDQLNVAADEAPMSWQRGESVVIREGPFAGHEAIFDACLSDCERVRILLSLLQDKQIPLQLSRTQIERKKQTV